MAKSNISRLGDTATGVCAVHGPVPGEITSSASKSKCEGVLIARVGDTVEASCGHTGVIDKGSSSVLTEGAETARIADTFSGIYSGEIVGGASKSFAGD